ncbi:hypothetical protein [Pseudomonas sp. EGD-AK9]|uniref:hypothetical protein n=1 Tax=Pseudomonas sp. EGD-AK9 TaxID=1386078 RepID=UPI0004040C4D|nr:hypothetical protein [Pseudomonas sp. EGD-AK9]
MQNFADQYLCQPLPTPAEVWAAAERYVREAEAFDRTVCTGPIIDGAIMPATPRERAVISRAADELFSRLVAIGAGRYTSDDLHRAIVRIERLPA